MHTLAKLFFAVAVASASSSSLAHPGGLNAQGCHTNRKTGDYHCHGGKPSRSDASASDHDAPRQANKMSGKSIVGVPTVSDGDTIRIGSERIRLEGIDAPESLQLCQRANNSMWRCGADSTNALRSRIGGRSIRCEISSKDRYNRSLGICWLGETDLNQWMVASGWAAAYEKYSTRYKNDEHVARHTQKNIWSSQFEMPWDWRARRRH